MTRAELLEVISNGESSAVEFKRDSIENFRLARELVAFSNFSGGSVLLGVEDDGEISGVQRANIEEWVMTLCRDKIRPAIIPFFEIVRNVEPGKDVAIVRVATGLSVHSLWHDNRNTYFIRVGSESREPTPEELGRLFQQRRVLRAELTPVSGASIVDLDMRRLQDYFGRVRGQACPALDDDLAWQALLENTEIAVPEGLALGGLLLFGKSPNRFFPGAGIDAAAYQGVSKDYATLERASIRGAMTPLMDGNGGLVESGIVEQALAFVARNTPVTAILEDGARRVERHAFPESAVREAVVNAVIHRDYMLGNSDIELSIFADRLEVTSPGRLSNGITVDRMRAGCRVARNQLLKDIMRDYGYLEHMGMGVPRKIIAGMLAANGTDPEFIVLDEALQVILYRWRSLS